MSKYAMVSADFPDIDSSEREKIYECLKKKKWKKFTNVGRDISTTWWAQFEDEASDSGVKRTTVSDFKKCSEPYTTPLLVVQVGTSKPEEY